MLERSAPHPAPPIPGLLAVLPTHALILAFLAQIFALLRLRHPALLARLALYRPAGARFWQARPWHALSWGQSPSPADAPPSRQALYLARILYVLGPPPRRGMRPLPNRTPTPRPTPPIRPPPPEKPARKTPGFPTAEPRLFRSTIKTLVNPLAPPPPSR